MRTYTQILKEGRAVTDEDVMDFIEDLPTGPNYSVALAGKALKIVRANPDYTEADARKWVTDGKIPAEVTAAIGDKQRRKQYDKDEKRADREEKRNAPKEPSIAKTWSSYIKGVASDSYTDLKDDAEEGDRFNFQNYVTDMAQSMMMDPEVKQYVIWKWYEWNNKKPTMSQAVEWLADELYDNSPET